MPESVRRWDVFWAYLDPVAGAEQSGRRPVLVISNDAFNARFPIVTVLPVVRLERKRRRVYPFEVDLPAAEAGLGWPGLVMPFQLRTLAKDRLRRRIGSLADANTRARVEDGLIDQLGIDFDA